MCTGAASIDDRDMLRAGGMPILFDGIYAPSTFGTLLPEFSFGHARQLESVLRQHLIELTERTELLVGIDDQVFVNLAVTLAYVGNFLWRRAEENPPGPVTLGPLALSVTSLLALAAAGYLGGKLAFRYGVRVAAETTQAEGYRAHHHVERATAPGRHAARPTTATDTTQH